MIRLHLHSRYHCRTHPGHGLSHRHPWRSSYLLECQRYVKAQHHLPRSQRFGLVWEILSIGMLFVSDWAHRAVMSQAYSAVRRPLDHWSASAVEGLWVLALETVLVMRTRPDEKTGPRPS